MRAGISAFCLAMLWVAPAAADPTAADLAAHRAAGEQLGALIGGAREQGDRPDLETAEAAGLIEIISNAQKVLRPGEYDPDELGDLLAVCQVANQVAVGLVLFGVTPEQMARPGEVATVASRNTEAFQSQLARVQPFLLRCLAKEVPALERFMATLAPEEMTDVRKDGLKQARAGIFQIYVGTLQAANDVRYREDYRLALLSALAETSDRFVSIITPEVRRELLGLVRAAADQAQGPSEVHLGEIARQLADESCGSLCKL